MARRPSTTKGFKQTASILGGRIRKAGESRGFAVSKVLTHWDEIVGPDLAAMSKPVKVGYARKRFGATLTVLTKGAQAPLLEMRKEQMRSRVNAAYGYDAISRIHITQTAPQGFSDPATGFKPAPNQTKTEPDAQIAQAAKETAGAVSDSDLRLALERLGRHVLSKSKPES